MPEVLSQLESEPTVETITEKLGEVPFDIPAKWKWCILETAAVINPKIGACNDNLTITFVPMKCVAEGYNNSILHPEVKHWKDVKNGFSKFQDNDVLLAKITPCFQNRKSAIAYNLINNTGAGSTEFHILRARASIVTPGYLLLFFKSEYFISYGIKKFKGVVGQQRISTNDLKSTPLPLPPLNAQSRIVEQAKKLLTIIDKVATKCGEVYDFLLPRFKNILLEKALHGSLVPQLESEPEVSQIGDTPDNPPFLIPGKWKWVHLGDVAELNPKVTADDSLEVSFISMNKLQQGFRTTVDYSTVKLWKDVKKGFSRFSDGDILLAKITPCFQNKKSAILQGCINGIGAGSTEFHVLRIKNVLFSEYLLFFLKTDFFINYGVENFKGTAGQQRLGTQDLKECLIPLPPVDEQKRIVQHLKKLLDETLVFE